MSTPNPDLRLLDLRAAGRAGARGAHSGDARGGVDAVDAEVEALYALQEAGFTLAPLRLVPAAAEESFYRLNNLPGRLNALFSGLDFSDPDEDDIEELAPEAQALLNTHYLLDEFVDLFYEGLKGLPGRVRLRRPQVGRARPPGRVAARGRPALLALKHLWADDWSFEELTARLKKGGVALAARPVLVGSADEENRDAPKSQAASDILGKPVSVWSVPGGVSRVVFD